MVEKRERKTTDVIEAGDVKGRTKIGLHCIGEICFGDKGFVIKIPNNADPRCAKKTAELILGGADVTFEVPGKGFVKGEDIDDGKGN